MPRVKQVTAPAVEPVTVDEAKLHAHISYDVEDDIIRSWISAAREQVEAYTGRAYITQTVDVVYDDWPGAIVCLPRSPLQSITSIRYYDTTDTERTVDSGIYQVDTNGEPGRVILNFSAVWPSEVLRPANSVIFRCVVGQGDSRSAVSQRVRDAIMMYCSYRDDNRAGEYGEIPAAFYQLLRHDRLYV
jgi:uncharacterized phiE125 gp8 family phage protein